jgi:hypothetical protein
VPLFAYRAVDDQGRMSSGSLDASNAIDLELRLRRLGLDLVTHESVKRTVAMRTRRVSRPELITFCFHLSQLLKAGVNIIEALTDLRDTVDNAGFRQVVAGIIEDIEGGQKLSEAMANHPYVFDAVFVHGRNAWAEGVGERLTAIDLPSAWYLLASPGVHAATAGLFQAPDLTRNAAPAKIADFLSGTALGNAFEPVLRRREPAVEALFEALARIGTPRLTGSGSGCFVEFATRESAEAALAALPVGVNAWLARGADRSPLLDAVESFTTGASPSG